MRQRLSLFGLLAIAVVWGGSARADFLTSFEGALQPTTPAAGWSYLWNSGGAIGNTANYSKLLATTDPTYYYNSTGTNGLPGPTPGYYVFFGGAAAGVLGGHPGRGSGDSGSGGIERFAIAAYTLSVGGQISISNSLLSNIGQSSAGLDLRIYVDNSATPVFTGTTAPGMGSNVSFNTNLGLLKAGDTIYVAIGGGVTDINDTFGLKYTISANAAVPEPASLTLLATGLVGLLGFKSRHRALRPWHATTQSS